MVQGHPSVVTGIRMPPIHSMYDYVGDVPSSLQSIDAAVRASAADLGFRISGPSISTSGKKEDQYDATATYAVRGKLLPTKRLTVEIDIPYVSTFEKASIYVYSEMSGTRGSLVGAGSVDAEQRSAFADKIKMYLEELPSK